METEKIRKTKKNFKLPIWAVAVIILLIIIGLVTGLNTIKQSGKKSEVITASTLQKIVNDSELSTYTAVYNGVAEVMNEKKPEETDYYVSYEAKIYAGIDFKDIEILVDDAEKTICLKLPEISILKIDVDISSMDFIFFNKKANASSVSQTAYSACEEDAKKESGNQKAIYELARQNACNVLKALIHPIVEQADEEYTLSII